MEKKLNTNHLKADRYYCNDGRPYCRLTAPIMWFFICEGFFHKTDKRYMDTGMGTDSTLGYVF